MSEKKDTVQQTILIAAILSLVCSVIVSFLAVQLKPIQEKNQEIDKKKNILRAAGLLEGPGDEKEIDEIFEKSVKARLVDLETGGYVQGVSAANYDQYKMAKEPKEMVHLPSEIDKAGIRRIARYAAVYEIMKDGQLDQVVLPIHGKGLWSTLYGFIAVAADSNTVRGLGFYEHKETPGLGAEVDNPDWKQQWPGKKLRSEDGVLRIKVLKGLVDNTRPAAKHQIDGLSGATITARGVSELVRFWVGPNGFLPYLNRIKEMHK